MVTDILEVLRGLSINELENQRAKLIESVIRTEAEIATLAHVIVAVKAINSSKSSPLVTTASDAIFRPQIHFRHESAPLHGGCLPPAEIRVETQPSPNSVCQAFNTTMENLQSIKPAAESNASDGTWPTETKPVATVATTDAFDMTTVPMERRVRTYLEVSGSSSAMLMARAFGLPNAKTLTRMLESDPSYVKDSRGFWSIKK